MKRGKKKGVNFVVGMNLNSNFVKTIQPTHLDFFALTTGIKYIFGQDMQIQLSAYKLPICM